MEIYINCAGKSIYQIDSLPKGVIFNIIKTINKIVIGNRNNIV